VFQGAAGEEFTGLRGGPGPVEDDGKTLGHCEAIEEGGPARHVQGTDGGTSSLGPPTAERGGLDACQTRDAWIRLTIQPRTTTLNSRGPSNRPRR